MSNPSRHHQWKRYGPKRLLTEALIAVCFESDGDKIPAQIVYGAVEAVQTARDRLGGQIEGTFLCWRVRGDIIILVMGLTNLKVDMITVDGLPRPEFQLILQGEWYHGGRFPTMVRNTSPRSIIRQHWGPEVLADFTRAICHT